MTSENISTGNITIDEEFTRENIEKNKQIKLVDSDIEAGLDLFSYIHCESTDSELIKSCRGVVFKGNQVVMKGFPYTYELNEEDNVPEIRNKIDMENCSFYDSHEGSVIRMFYFNGKWYLSTNRKLDAFRSKWASKDSFGSFFKKALQYEFENNEKLIEKIGEYNKETDIDNVINIFADKCLNQNNQYMFLLLNNKENRIVCNPSETPTIFHVGTFINGNLSMNENVCIQYPQRHYFKTIEELLGYVYNIDYKKLQGVIVFAPNNLQIKVFNKDYHYLYNVRGNEPSIKFRYLQVRTNIDFKESMYFMYPEYHESFDKYENYIHDIAGDITDSYIERFIKKNYVTVPTEEFNVIRKCHSWHIENRLENKINVKKVIEILNAEPPTNINRMIKRRILSEKDDGQQPPTTKDVSGERRRGKPDDRKKKYISILTNKPVSNPS